MKQKFKKQLEQLFKDNGYEIVSESIKKDGIRGIYFKEIKVKC